MSSSFLIAGSIYLGWLLSPEALVLVSNLAGKGGMFAAFSLLAAAGITFYSIHLKNRAQTQSPAVNGSNLLSTSCDLAGAVSLVIFLSTGMFVTAGFTFNETFLYWFPNFGFSALLLSLILIIHLIGYRAIELSQKIFASVTLLCLLIIILTGLFTADTIDQAGPYNVTTALPTQALAFTSGGLLLFLGAHQPQIINLSSRQIFSLITIGALLLFSWEAVALKHVPAAKLAESTIPYIYVAREVLGQAGRILIGIAIISGTCAAINYFFSVATHTATRLITNSLTTSKKIKSSLQRLLSLIFAVSISICMASGLAGEPHLEIYIYGALLLWLLSVGLQLLKGSLLQNNVPHTFVTAIFLVAFLYLTMAHDESSSLVMFIILALCLSIIFTSAVMLIGKTCDQKQSQ